MEPTEILMEEYKIHAQELTVQIQLYHRQTQFIQLYGAILASLVALITRFPSGVSNNSGSPDALSKLPNVPSGISLLLLILGATVAFYLVSAALSSSYIFLILRRRMAEIEKRINDLVGEPDLLKYERITTRTFLEQSYYAPGGIAPHLLSAVFRVLMLAAVVSVLVVLSGHLLTRTVAYFYTWTVLFAGIFLVFEYARLYSPGGRRLIDTAYDTPQPAPTVSILRYPLGLVVNYLAIISLLYFYTYGGLGEWLNRLAYSTFGAQISALNPIVGTLSIVVYTFLAGTVLPTPSEAPILLHGQLSLLTILLASAVGKGIGAALIMSLMISGKLIFPKRALMFVPSIDESKRGLLVYFACQAIPFAPMRSSTIILGALVSRKSMILKAALLCSLATVIRMLLMWGLISLGAVASTHLVPTS